MRRRLGLKMALVLALAMPLGCSERKSEQPAPRAQAAPASAQAATERPAIVFLGDSLTAGLGLRAEESYPALIERRMLQAGYPYRVVNAGVSGDTSAGGLRRLDWALEGDVAVVVVALGGNDGLRGLSPEQLRDNLVAIVDGVRTRGIPVLVAGMEAPPNNGAEYTAAFRGVYSDLARRSGVVSVPFLLAGVAGQPSLNQADGIHPNAAGAAVVAQTVWKALEPMLTKQATP